MGYPTKSDTTDWRFSMPPWREELIFGVLWSTNVSRGMESMPTFWLGTS